MCVVVESEKEVQLGLPEQILLGASPSTQKDIGHPLAGKVYHCFILPQRMCKVLLHQGGHTTCFGWDSLVGFSV